MCFWFDKDSVIILSIRLIVSCVLFSHAAEEDKEEVEEDEEEVEEDEEEVEDYRGG